MYQDQNTNRFKRVLIFICRALVDGGTSREMWSDDDAKWESEFEKTLMNEKLRKREHRATRSQRASHQQRTNEIVEQGSDRIIHDTVENTIDAAANEQDKLTSGTHNNIDALFHEPLNENEPHHQESVGTLLESKENPPESVDDSLPRKRRRPQVDYKELYEQMKKEESVNKVPE